MKYYLMSLLCILCIVGCEDIDLDHSSSENSSSAEISESSDEVLFESLNWIYGGVRGGSAKHDSSDPIISGLKFGKSLVSFKYNRNLSCWRLSNDNAGALACLFVKNNSGKWIGGKFDWISSSRTSRDYKNIFDGYNGWSLNDVSNPCDACFVIITESGKKRSNVIKGTWSR